MGFLKYLRNVLKALEIAKFMSVISAFISCKPQKRMLMQKYLVEYTAKGGKLLSSSVTAKSEAEALRKARKLGNVTHISLAPKRSMQYYMDEFERRYMSSVKLTDIIGSFTQIAFMMKASSVEKCFEEAAKGTQNKQLAYILNQVASDINSGMMASVAMKKHDCFDDVVIAMMRLGEATGKMDESLIKLTEILKDMYENSRKFKKAMRYPIMVICAITGAFVFLMLSVVPQFEGIFSDLGVDLPLATQILFSIKTVMQSYGHWVLGGLIATGLAIKYYRGKSEDFARNMDALMLRIKIIGPIILYSNLYRFNLILTELTRAGNTIEVALVTAIDTVGNLSLQQKLSSVRSSILNGQGTYEGFASTGLYDGMMLQMIRAGDETGNMDQMLGHVSEFFKGRFEDKIDNLSSAIEPIIMFFIAGMVLLLALGIFLPMWDMGSAVNG